MVSGGPGPRAHRHDRRTEVDVTAPHESPAATDSRPALAPMSLERVEESLDRLGYAFVEDEEHPDVLRARFDDYRFQFMLTGDEHGVMQTRGRWNHTVDISRKIEMLKICNEWNMGRVWPKVYVRRENEGMLGLYAETTHDFDLGATDTQIDRALSCGLRTVISFFHELEARIGPEVEDLDS